MSDKKIITARCGKCQFSVLEKDGMYCWFDPPSVFPSQRQNMITKTLEMGWMTVAPQVHADRWCGRYKKADK